MASGGTSKGRSFLGGVIGIVVAAVLVLLTWHTIDVKTNHDPRFSCTNNAPVCLDNKAGDDAKKADQ